MAKDRKRRVLPAQDEKRVVELREEQLVAHKELRDRGEIVIRTEVETVPAQLEVEALRQEVEVEHEPVGRVVTEREDVHHEEGVLIVPVYEEELVVTKRLILRERLHVRRVERSDKRLIQDDVQRERVVVEDPQHTGMVHEVGRPAEDDDAEPPADNGLITRLVTKALE
jgi:uncharacterized protein (TIGR02271 family)